MYDYQIDPDYVNDSLSELQEKISEMEDRSRRNNIRVDGVTEEKGETWEDCEKKVLEILREEVYNGDIWHATGSGFFKFLTTLKLLKTTKITISQKTPFFKITKK